MATYGTRFPKYLSGMIQILWWEMDEAAMIFMMFASALIFGGLMWVGVFVVPWCYIKVKRRGSRGYFKHFLYSLGLVKLNGYPSSFERSFTE